ncbi:MAG: hypothetical protein JWP01_941 [Myxococcales bacterium]|nr:hypothetical protein [Myxococcales bacterium]
MATKRRGGGGFRPPELRGTLGTLLRTAIQQAGGVRDALERGARQGKSRLDELRTDRKRTDILADLGELVLDLIRRGEIDIAELPEARDLVRDLDELDAADAQEDITSTQPFERRRFDDRGAPAASRAAPRGRDADDGTVGSGARWAPKAPSRPSAPESSASARVWRPTAEDVEAAPIVGRDMPRHPHKGGITFEDDDLADYMHPDDVPPKDPTGGDS